MKNKIYIIKTTFNDIKDVNKLQNILLEKNLASCIQINQIKSAYIWEGKICNEDEIQLSIKTNKKNAKKIESIILDTHPYEIPQILILKSKASKSYLKWHKNELRD
ncbi:divalent-cation tolerance protein CutA [Helicobacter sp. MIT 99-5507]|uniref:divalent-cation tolerance protein CutA n=1 Tax=Helicobacter sp. MIT 99-5507 TaxID=152489 RepID=UPI000E1F2F30|nr:divalent-cation tolerance protein CutA [Helicobacter sp. MIT 99-5507]RDU58089.1 divalent-cation tolerance protein CutA [Helicobacter sp. MIT 99-5507]